jgi:hypothetical protein
VLLPAVLQAAIVTAFGSRMFLWDEFVYVPAFEQIGEGRPWLHWIWQQHNEHRIVWTKLLFFAHAGWSGWNPIVDMYVSAAADGADRVGHLEAVPRGGPRAPGVLRSRGAAAAAVSPQYMNILYGLMTCHYFTHGRHDLGDRVPHAGETAGRDRVRVRGTGLHVERADHRPIGLLVLVLTRQKPVRWIVWCAAMLGVRYACTSTRTSGRRRFRPSIGRPPPRIRQVRRYVSREPRLAALGRRARVGPRARRDDVGGLVLLWLGVVRSGRRESHAGLLALSAVAVGCAARDRALADRRWAGRRRSNPSTSPTATLAPRLGVSRPGVSAGCGAPRRFSPGLTVVIRHRR